MKKLAKESDDEVNARQELFCQTYVSKDFFGNGVESYLEVYDIDRSKPNWYKTACVCASKLLSNAKVCARINELLDEAGLNDNFVDKQLLFTITQHNDLGSKMAAIREYNKLKQRVIDRSQSEVTIYSDLPDDKLDALIAAKFGKSQQGGKS